ncbi:hypothetical protein [Enterococcus casseliflavus]|uniref:hypothetical protein n=1 Tax=Enterococcus casseliflavus TaxID=37734 RepID=UPI0037CAC26E
MKITIEGTPNEAKELPQAIGSSEEQKSKDNKVDIKRLVRSIHKETTRKKRLEGIEF